MRMNNLILSTSDGLNFTRQGEKRGGAIGCGEIKGKGWKRVEGKERKIDVLYENSVC